MKSYWHWLVFALIALLLVAINFSLSQRVQRQQRSLREAEQRQVELQAANDRLKDLESKRRGLMSGLNETRDQALNMMRLCRTPAEFIPIHPRLIHSKITTEAELGVLFHLPPGKHRLGVQTVTIPESAQELTSEELARDELARDEDVFQEGEIKLVDLEGEKSYLALVELGETKGRYFEKFDKIKISVSGRPLLELQNPLEGGEVVGQSYRNREDLIVLPSQLPENFVSQIVLNGWNPDKFQHPKVTIADFGLKVSDGHEEVWVRIRLTIESDAKPQFQITDRQFLQLWLPGMESTWLWQTGSGPQPQVPTLKLNPDLGSFELLVEETNSD